jgi:1-deoxy-D-xylulose-5-phosphate reductoisomerase
VLNAANEVAVEAFLAGTIRFPEIALVVAETVSRLPREEGASLTAILDADLAARMQAASIIEALRMQTQQRLGNDVLTPALPPGQTTLTI